MLFYSIFIHHSWSSQTTLTFGESKADVNAQLKALIPEEHRDSNGDGSEGNAEGASAEGASAEGASAGDDDKYGFEDESAVDSASGGHSSAASGQPTTPSRSAGRRRSPPGPS